MNKTTTRPRPFTANGDKIFKLRKRTGLSQERIAPLAGISRRYWIQLEKGESLPSAQVRDRMAAALGADPKAIQSSEDEDEESSLPLTRQDFAMLGDLFSRLGVTMEQAQS